MSSSKIPVIIALAAILRVQESVSWIALLEEQIAQTEISYNASMAILAPLIAQEQLHVSIHLSPVVELHHAQFFVETTVVPARVNTQITCGTATSCDIECYGVAACSNSVINCGTSNSCSIKCIGNGPCEGTEGSGSIDCKTSDCSIECEGELRDSRTCTLPINTSSAASFECTGLDCSNTPDPFTSKPTYVPSMTPSNTPSGSPTNNPSAFPSYSPFDKPSVSPTKNPSTLPSNNPSIFLSSSPTTLKTGMPTPKPTIYPSDTRSKDKEVVEWMHTTTDTELSTTNQGKQSHSVVLIILCISLGIVLIGATLCAFCVYRNKTKRMDKGHNSSFVEPDQLQAPTVANVGDAPVNVDENKCGIKPCKADMNGLKVTDEGVANNDEQGVHAVGYARDNVALVNDMGIRSVIQHNIVPDVRPVVQNNL
eukprot:547774_1